jgi:hypothetical protein
MQAECVHEIGIALIGHDGRCAMLLAQVGHFGFFIPAHFTMAAMM